jgi:putative ABC transport system permease protein
MSPSFISLGPFDLVVAAGLVVAAAAISLALKLGLERRLAVASVRTVVQLGLIGLILERIFALDRPLPVIGLLAVMILLAGREAVGRSSRGYRGIYLDAWLAMAVSCLTVGGIVTQVVVGVTPWYTPQYLIPLLGMILGNSLNGISLSLDRLLDHLATRHAEVELRLAFGATRHEALREPLAAAVRTGMVPILNSMAAAGIVSLPGMMTGQILAGSPPMQAVAYQVVVMFMIAAATAIGAMLVAVVAARRLVGADGVLELARITGH